MLEYEIQDLEAAELPLLFSSWSRSYRYATKENRRTPAPVYYRAERALIDEILARFPLLLVARAGNVALGWICAEATDAGVAAHYIFVKPEYREIGIARALFNAALHRLDALSGPGQYATHIPDRLKGLVERYRCEPMPAERVGRERKGAA